MFPCLRTQARINRPGIVHALTPATRANIILLVLSHGLRRGLPYITRFARLRQGLRELGTLIARFAVHRFKNARECVGVSRRST